MKKLTADKCREFISVFKSLEKEGHLALTSGYHLQALEIALPILEQQERGDGDWIEWGGGECPVPPGTIVDVRYRSGQVEKSACAWGWGSCPGTSEASSAAGAAFWENDSIENDITAYLIIPEQPTNQNGEQ